MRETIQPTADDTLDSDTTPGAAEDMDYVGQVFGGKYRILEKLTKGGMSQIFRAEQIALRRHVAIKVILKEQDLEASQQFLLEASLTANLDHPHIVKVHDFGRTHAGTLFLVMELINGQTLKEWVAEHGPLSTKDAIQLTRQMCGALSEAHDKSLVHRDIKPSNILMSRRAGAGLTTKLIDFGLVEAEHYTGKASNKKRILGTPMYMAPEQIEMKSVDDRVDIYALGLTLFYALTGRTPYMRNNVQELMRAQLKDPLPRLASANPTFGEDHPLQWIVDTATAKVPADRFQNCLQMLHSLDVAHNHLERSPFPVLTIVGGLLHVDGERIEARRVVPIQPRVQTGAYLEGGYKLADDFARTMSLSGEFESFSSVFGDFETGTFVGTSNLTESTNAFVGREQELTTLAQHLERGTRLLTLVGTGGTGKTRLATQFGLQNVTVYDGGVWFVDLSQAMSYLEICQEVGRALNVPLTASDPVLQLSHAIRSRGRTLLILDNFEHLVDEAKHTLVQWMKHAPDARFLVTSRQRLGLAGEHLIELNALPLEEGVLLFAHRVQAVRPNFTVSQSNRSVVEEIVNRLDGLSLAIELAAARCAVLQPKQLLSRLSERFQLLKSSDRDADHRQATLRNAIDWSWQLLTLEEQTALAQLSIFVGDFTLEDVEAVIENPSGDIHWVLDIIQALHEKSLLKRREDGDAVYFGMYHSILEFAAEQLAAHPKQQPALQDRYRDYYTAQCEQFRTEETDVRAAFKAQKRMYPNLVQAYEFAKASGGTHASGVLMLAMLQVLEQQGPNSETISKANEFLGLPDVNPGHRASVFCVHLISKRKIGSVVDEFAKLEEALQWALEAEDIEAETACRMALVQRDEDIGERDAALETIHSSIAALNAKGAEKYTFNFYYALGEHHLTRGHLDKQAEALEEATRLVKRFRLREHRGRLGHQRGRHFEQLGQIRNAYKEYSRGLTAYTRSNDIQGQARLLGCLANNLRTLGDYDEARAHYEAAMRLNQDFGDRFRAAMIQGNMGNLLLELEDFEGALRAYRSSGKVFAEMGNRKHQAVSLSNEGEVLIRMERLQEARAALVESVELCQQTGFKGEGAFLIYLARVERLEGRHDEAQTFIAQGIEKLEQTQQNYYLAVAHCEQGQLALEQKNRTLAKTRLAEAQAFAKESEVNPRTELGVNIQLLEQALENKRGFLDKLLGR